MYVPSVHAKAKTVPNPRSIITWYSNITHGFANGWSYFPTRQTTQDPDSVVYKHHHWINWVAPRASFNFINVSIFLAQLPQKPNEHPRYTHYTIQVQESRSPHHTYLVSHRLGRLDTKLPRQDERECSSETPSHLARERNRTVEIRPLRVPTIIKIITYKKPEKEEEEKERKIIPEQRREISRHYDVLSLDGE